MQQADHQEVLDQALEEFKALIEEEINKDNKWENVSEVTDFKVVKKKDIKPVLVRVECILDATPDEILGVLFDFESRKKLDDKINEVQVLKKIDDDSSVYYFKIAAGIPFMEDRDFVVAFRRYSDNGSIYFIQVSIEDEQKPKINKVTRGHYYQNSFKFTPQDNNKTQVQAITHIEIDFNPPSGFMAEKRATSIKKIQEQVIQRRNQIK